MSQPGDHTEQITSGMFTPYRSSCSILTYRTPLRSKSLPTSPETIFCRRRPILHRHGWTGLIRFWIDLFSGTQILDLHGLVLRPRGTVQQR